MSSRSMKSKLAAFRGIQFAADPVARSFCNLAASDDECVVHEDMLSNLRIENIVPEHHQCLIVDFGDIDVGAFADTAVA